jgi:hypothetical protein
MIFTFLFLMQTLTGISSGKNNKSCRIIHNRSNQIGFAFFRFVCNFLRNLQGTGNSLYYWSYPFAGRPSKRSLVSQCGPWARPAGADCSIPVSSPMLAAGEGRGEVLDSWGLDLGGGFALGDGRRAAHRRLAAAAAAAHAAVRQSLVGGWPGRGKGGEWEGHSHDETTGHLINRRRAPYRSRRTAGLPGVPTAVRRRRVEHAGARPPRRLGARKPRGQGLESRASRRRGAAPAGLQVLLSAGLNP